MPDESEKIARLESEAKDHLRVEHDLSGLVERLRREARAREEVIARQLERIAADEKELDDLRAVREALTPPDLGTWPGLDLAAAFLPASGGVSGDFYLVAEGPEGSTTFVVGDVVGKGPVAARRAAFARTVFATAAPFSNDPAQLLSWANTALAERTADAVDFVTAACITYSPDDSVLCSAYAAHPPILRLDTGVELGGGRALPLGISDGWACSSERHRLQRGAGVLIYTDGVTEARRNGDQFGEARLTESIRRSIGFSASEVVAAITSEVEEFASSKLRDDVCVIAARTEQG